MKVVIAQDGETLDALLWRVLGRTDPIEAVLEANPLLARQTVLSAGERVIIPDLPPPPVAPIIRLWS